MSLPEEPTLSWLIMERYVLGELSEAERRAVELGLANSEANRKRLQEIRSDQSVLPELPTMQGQQSTQPAPRSLDAARQRTLGAGRGWVGLGSWLAAAALVGLAFVSLKDTSMRTPADDLQRNEARSDHTKGGEIALELVNEQGEHTPARFAQGERFKVLVTCPPNFREQLHLLVFQAGQRFEPLAPTRFACGNLLPWPGAFTLDGDQDVEVCVAWGAQAARAMRRGDLGDSAVCHALASH